MAKSKAKSEDEIFHDAVSMVSRGTVIRDAISFIVQAATGVR